MSLLFSTPARGAMLRRAALSLLTVAWLVPASARAADEYRIQPGDGLEMAVAGFPDLRQRVTVNVDGVIAVPVFGSFTIAGKTLAEALALVRDAVPSKAIHMRTPDGRDNLFAVEAGEVSLALVDYRPIYLRGDVAKPGEQAFRPGLTVRQAVSLAGGYDLVRFRVTNPFLDAADLRSQYESLWTDYARQQLRAARLQAELDGRDLIDTKSLFRPPLPTPVLDQLTDLELQQLKINQQNNRAETEYLRKAAAQAETYVGQLSELQRQLAAGTAAQAENLKRIQAAFDKGLAAINRMTDEQRALLAQSDRTLTVASELTKAQKSLQEASRDIDRTADKRRTQLLADLQDAKARMAALTSSIQGVSDKLLYVGSLRSQLVRGTGNRVQLLVFRKGPDGKTQQIAANEDASLVPGDVVEVALRTEDDYVAGPKPR
ncbi:polysaccharide export protein [Alsobacter soli]|uniref:Polysaccharide export protein n=1 Tax=Alsobacter soli TaxID=2109933 RepID=A0A2T1HN95_9HYPH|nr:polysaccharide biosynthesis/export family protein [Alsobacter soli]PSC03116.1 polysaccharide export protein [Alsobacter soli]